MSQPNPRTKYNVAKLVYALGVIKEFNGIKLEELDFYIDDKPLTVKEGAVEEFRFVGLSNVEFVTCVVLPENGVTTYREA
jgi:hypothetical protein